MIGAIIGDMVGSVYESNQTKSKNVPLMNIGMRMTDDSLLTLAVCDVLMSNFPIKYDKDSLLKIQNDLKTEFVNVWKSHKNVGFGYLFYNWCEDILYRNKAGEPYNSCGNGSAMRISPVAWVANCEEEVKILSKTVTEITHNHPEGLKGAEATAMCIYLALHGASKEEIKRRMIDDYYPEIKEFSFEDLLENYKFSDICQKSVPQAIFCFLISNSFEDCIRNCIAIGGDCDTICAISGSIAEAYYNRDHLSKFEDNFIYFNFPSGIEKKVKKFYRIIDSKKFSLEDRLEVQ